MAPRDRGEILRRAFETIIERKEELALLMTLEPVFAWLTSFIYLKERLGVRAGAGALLILGGVLLSELLGQVEKPDEESQTGGKLQASSGG